MTEIQIGRLLSASSRGCVAGCQVGEPLPAFGSMVTIDADQTDRIYGIITNIRIVDDGLIRQLAASRNLPEEIIQDNRLNRNVPVELSVVFIGYLAEEKIFHMLPPQPPLSLDRMRSSSEAEIREFTSTEAFAYLRHLLSVEDIPPADLAAAHLLQAARMHQAAGNQQWILDAVRAAVRLLRNEYDQLSAFLTACAGVFSADMSIGGEEEYAK